MINYRKPPKKINYNHPNRPPLGTKPDKIRLLRRGETIRLEARR